MGWLWSMLSGISLTAIVLIAQWVIRLVLIPIILKRHRPAVATTWLIVVFFEPFIGLIIYLVIGRQLVGRKRIEHHERVAREVEQRVRGRFADEHVVAVGDLPHHRRDLARLAQHLSGMPAVSGNRVTLIDRTDAVIDRLIEDIDHAQHHVHLLFYIYAADTTGLRVADALTRAAQRGVTCRVMMDSQGSPRALEQIAPQMRAKGIEVVEVLPAGLLRRRVARIDVRNHRKLAIIDGMVGYAGSQNIVDADYGGKFEGAWRDLMIRIEGPVLTQLQSVFFEDWAAETSEALPDDLLPGLEPIGETLAVAVPSGPSLRVGAFRDIMLAAINEADERVIMTTPYLVLDEPTLLALQIRARAGVRVDVVIPERSNNRLVNLASRAQYESLLKAGVNLHLHQDGLLHAKSLSIDGTISLIGSGNMDRRSFEVNYELSLLMAGGSVAAELVELQKRYMSESRILTMDEWQSRSRWDRIAQDSAKLFSAVL